MCNSPCCTFACPLWKKWKASEALGLTCFTTGKMFNMSSSVKVGLWRLSKLYSFIRIYRANESRCKTIKAIRLNKHRMREGWLDNVGYLDARFDWNFSEQSGFLEAVFLHHLVHALTAKEIILRDQWIHMQTCKKTDWFTQTDGVLTTVSWSDNNSGPQWRCFSITHWASGWPMLCCHRHRGPCCDVYGSCGVTLARRVAGAPQRQGRNSRSSLGNGSQQQRGQTTPHPTWQRKYIKNIKLN